MIYFALLLIAATVAFVWHRHDAKRRKALFTAACDLDKAGVSRPPGQKLDGTAVICGGSISGLLAARVCADHFSKVVIVEPEAWLATEEGVTGHHREFGASKRSHVPQYTALHSYHPFTSLTLQRLFPNFKRQVDDIGGIFAHGQPMASYQGRTLQYPSEIPLSIFITRPAYETILRRLVLQEFPNVEFRTGSVVSLKPTSDNWDDIESVAVRSGNDAAISQMPAQLVVDCTGTSHGGLRWLPDFDDIGNSKGLPLRKLKATYDPKMQCSTCEFNVPQAVLDNIEFPFDFKAQGTPFVYNPNPKEDCRYFIISRRERGFLHITCGGWDVRRKMQSVSDIKEFVAGIISEYPFPPWVHSLVDALDDPNIAATYTHMRVPPSVYVQYHLAAKLPSNFIAIGDSVMQLNPIRGQGCSKAAVDAVTLDGLLRACDLHVRLPSSFSRDFFASQARRIGDLWATARSIDYAYSTTTPIKGEDLSYGASDRAFRANLMTLVHKDANVAGVFWRVGAWLESPKALSSPSILIKLWWISAKGKVSLHASK